MAGPFFSLLALAKPFFSVWVKLLYSTYATSTFKCPFLPLYTSHFKLHNPHVQTPDPFSLSSHSYKDQCSSFIPALSHTDIPSLHLSIALLLRLQDTVYRIRPRAFLNCKIFKSSQSLPNLRSPDTLNRAYSSACQPQQSHIGMSSRLLSQSPYHHPPQTPFQRLQTIHPLNPIPQHLYPHSRQIAG